MVAKRSSPAVALLLILPSAALALGLGDIHLNSALNAPLSAEIDLVDVAPDEANTVRARIASPETFARYGLEWSAYLSGVQVRPAQLPDGRQVIKVTSSEPIVDPFVTLLLEVEWPRGHLMREYTVLLDPPVYAPAAAAPAAPVAAPAAGSSAREGTIAREASAASAPAAAAPAPAPTAAQPAAAPEAATATPAPVPAEPARKVKQAPRPEASESAAAGAGEGSTHVVERGETLSQIASTVSDGKASTRSWIVAIYQANPQAFQQNMNKLRAGAVLRIPDAAAAAEISPASAAAEIHRQYAAWRGEEAAPSAPAAEQAGRLRLVTPTEGAAAGGAAAKSPAATTPSAAAAGAAAKASAAQQSEAQAAEAKRLLELKNAELARMQAQQAAKAAPPAPAPAPPPAAAKAPAPGAQPPAAQPPAPPPAATAEKPAEAAPPPVKRPPPAAKKPVPAPAPAGGSFIDTLAGLWWVVLLLLLGAGGFVAVRKLRERRAAEFDDTLGRMAEAGAEAIEGDEHAEAAHEEAPMSARYSAPEAPAPRAARAAAAPEPGFVVEESGSHERPRIAAGAAAATASAAPRHVASDETISSETAINLDQGDPLAEADFHMAYGLYDQAADLVRIAISREPERRDLKLKLLEVFFVWGNKEQFLQSARELAESRDAAAPGEWEKILIMGKQLAPDDPLFSGGGAVTGAAAGGVDLDLEGGQSRVDFDLLGEPDGGAGGLDLDIGAAVGDQPVDVSTSTHATDRNAALETTYSSTTGTTRQMTARVQPEIAGGSTLEMEGPTIEQPALAQRANATLRQKVEDVVRAGTEATAELAVDDLGLDVGADNVDTIDQPGLGAHGESPTLVAGLDENTRTIMEQAHRRSGDATASGAWQFDQNELEAALTQTSAALQELSATGRLEALKGHGLDVDVGDATGRHAVTVTDIDLDVGSATGSHAAAGALDLDVGSATVPDTAFAATQKLSSEDLALPDLEPVTMSEVGTKLDLARAYMDMGDPDGARNILDEVLSEGSAAQKQEAQRLMESLPG